MNLAGRIETSARWFRYGPANDGGASGVDLKDKIGHLLGELGHEPLDLGTHGHAPVDYPDFAEELKIIVPDYWVIAFGVVTVRITWPTPFC